MRPELLEPPMLLADGAAKVGVERGPRCVRRIIEQQFDDQSMFGQNGSRAGIPR